MSSEERENSSRESDNLEEENISCLPIEIADLILESEQEVTRAIITVLGPDRSSNSSGELNQSREGDLYSINSPENKLESWESSESKQGPYSQ